MLGLPSGYSSGDLGTFIMAGDGHRNAEKEMSDTLTFRSLIVKMAFSMSVRDSITGNREGNPLFLIIQVRG